MTKKPRSTSVARRKFLKTGALAAGAAAAGTLAVPQVSRAQTVTLRMQGSWGAKDVFNEFAEDYVKRVNEMALSNKHSTVQCARVCGRGTACISPLMSFTSAAESAAHWGRQGSRRVDLSANNRFS